MTERLVKPMVDTGMANDEGGGEGSKSGLRVEDIVKVECKAPRREVIAIARSTNGFIFGDN